MRLSSMNYEFQVAARFVQFWEAGPWGPLAGAFCDEKR